MTGLKKWWTWRKNSSRNTNKLRKMKLEPQIFEAFFAVFKKIFSKTLA